MINQDQIRFRNEDTEHYRSLFHAMFSVRDSYSDPMKLAEYGMRVCRMLYPSDDVQKKVIYLAERALETSDKI